MNIVNSLSRYCISFQENFFKQLTVQHKRICAIAALALGFVTVCFAIRHYYLKMQSKPNEGKGIPLPAGNVAHGGKDQLALPTSEAPVIPAASSDASAVSTIDGDKSFLYLKKEEIKGVSIIKKDTYREAVTQLPICCVDVFLFNPTDRTYLLVLRKDPPAKGAWWLPGGRLYKGESFFECSMRKCKDEVGLNVTPVKTLGFAATLFPDSMWDSQTHTVNTLVFAKVNEQEAPKIDKTCADYRWTPIDSVPEDPYVKMAYNKALKVIKTLH